MVPVDVVVLEPIGAVVTAVGPPPLVLAARPIPTPAKAIVLTIATVLPSIAAFLMPAGLPAGSVVSAKAFVTSRLAARMAAPKIRIRFSIKLKAFRGVNATSTRPCATLSIHEGESGSRPQGKK